MFRDFFRWQIAVPFFLFLVILVYGFYMAWPSIVEGMGASSHFSFLQNLLAGGVGSLLTIVVVTPLTAYFTEKRRDRELSPVRKQFYREIGRRVAALSDQYLYKFSRLGLLVNQLEGVKRDKLLDDMLALSTLFARGAPLPKEQPPLSPEHYSKLVQAASLLAQVMDDFSALAKDIQSAGRLIDIYGPYLTPSMVAEFESMTSLLERSLKTFRSLAAYCRGFATAEERIQAVTGGWLEFEVMSNRYNELVVKAGFPELSGAANGASIDMQKQQRFFDRMFAVLDDLFYKEQGPVTPAPSIS